MSTSEPQELFLKVWIPGPKDESYVITPDTINVNLKDIISLLQNKCGIYYDYSFFKFYINTTYIYYTQPVNEYLCSEYPLVILPRILNLADKDNIDANKYELLICYNNKQRYKCLIIKKGRKTKRSKLVFASYDRIISPARRKDRLQYISFSQVHDISINTENKREFILKYGSPDSIQDARFQLNKDVPSEFEAKENEISHLLIECYMKIIRKEIDRKSVIISMDILNIIFMYQSDVAQKYNAYKCKEFVTQIQYKMKVKSIIDSYHEQ